MGIKGKRKRDCLRQAAAAANAEDDLSLDEEPPRVASFVESMTSGELTSRRRRRSRGTADNVDQFLLTDVVAAKSGDQPSEQAVRPTSQCSLSHPMLQLHTSLVDAMRRSGYIDATPVQARVIHMAMLGHDVLGQAMTGSGKTLAYLAPAINTAMNSTSKRLCALILAPTKELAAQVDEIARSLTGEIGRLRKEGDHSVVVPTTLLVGGSASVQHERTHLLAGVHIVVGTPGRVADHARHLEGWDRAGTRWLVLDEADRMLSEGFARDVNAIIASLPVSRQTLLLSATNQKSVHHLARLSLSHTPLLVDTVRDAPTPLGWGGEGSDATFVPPYIEGSSRMEGTGGEGTGREGAMPSTLTQYVFPCAIGDRLRVLYVLLKHLSSQKTMFFCSSIASVIFHTQMMGSVGFHDDVLMLHGKMKTRQRTQTWEEFLKRPRVALFCTDVAARGLDVPDVSWVVQLDAPLDPTTYVHRVGRTARAGREGSTLIVLSEEEMAFVGYLKRFGIETREMKLPTLPDIQAQLEHVLTLDKVVARSSVAAFRAHVSAYQSHVLTDVFDINKVDLQRLSRDFALPSPPQVTLRKKEKPSAYVLGKLKSLNRQKKEALRHYHQQKTKVQWREDGSFVGVHKPVLSRK